MRTTRPETLAIRGLAAIALLGLLAAAALLAAAPPTARAGDGGLDDGRAATMVQVIVVDARGAAVEGAEVLSGDDFFPPELFRERVRRGETPAARTDARGLATLPRDRVRAGRAITVFARSGGADGWVGPLDPGRGGFALKIVLRRVDEPRAGRGALRIRVTAGGAPLAGAEAWVELATAGGGSSSHRDVTDAGGTIVRRDVEPGSYLLGVAAAGFLRATAKIEVRAGEVTDAELALSEGGVVRGRLFLPPGAGDVDVRALRASADSREDDFGPGRAWRPDLRGEALEDGQAYRIAGLEPGEYALQAAVKGLGAATAKVTVVGPGEAVGPDLAPGAGIQVIGRLALPGPSGRRRVVLQPAAFAPAHPDLTYGHGSEAPGALDARLEADGRFAVRGVGPGSYVLRVLNMSQSSWGDEEFRREVDVPASAPAVDLGEVVVPPRFGRIEGRVVGRDGRPASVGTYIHNGSRQPLSADGGFGSNLLLEPGRYTVFATTPDGASPPLEIDLAAGETKELTLQVAEAGFIAGRVLAPPGLLEGSFAGLSIRHLDGSAPRRPPLGLGPGATFVELAGDGSFRTEGLPPGRYEIGVGFGVGRLQVPDGAPEGTEVRVAAGETAHVEIGVAVVDVRIDGLAEGETVMLGADWRPPGSAAPRKDERIDLGNGVWAFPGRSARQIRTPTDRLGFVVPGPGTIVLRATVRAAAPPPVPGEAPRDALRRQLGGPERTLPEREVPVEGASGQPIEVIIDAGGK
ncbi:MAG TPA: carboxypeptidase-like regulatory domain-containing protein [Planctomycetota bacterium]|nr:carboxypeptidase-like regulatory domain-containing protein [Planctomycetota bacterium]